MLRQLREDEFIILQDDKMHIVQMLTPFENFKPIILVLTNYQIFFRLEGENKDWKSISFSKITTFSQSDRNTITVLDIKSEDCSETIHLFMDDTRRETFISILSNLCTANEKSQNVCNRYAFMLKKQVESFSSLNKFYEEYATLPKIDLENMKEFSAFIEEEMQKQVTEDVSLNIFNFISDFIETSPRIFFILVAIIIALVSIIFQFISFGTLACILILGLIIQYGIQIVMNNVKKPNPVEINETSDSPLQQFVISSHNFHSIIEKRFLWGDSRKTLDTAAFTFFILLLFLIYSPRFLLIFSVLCLAFFERWKIFNIGPLSSILAKLIIW